MWVKEELNSRKLLGFPVFQKKAESGPGQWQEPWRKEGKWKGFHIQVDKHALRNWHGGRQYRWGVMEVKGKEKLRRVLRFVRSPG